MSIRTAFDEIYDSTVGIYTEDEKEMLEIMEIMKEKGFEYDSPDPFIKSLKKNKGIILVMDILSNAILFHGPLEDCWEDGFENLIRRWNGVSRFDLWNEEYSVFQVKVKISDGISNIAYISALDRKDLLENGKNLFNVSDVLSITEIKDMHSYKYLKLLDVIDGVKTI